MTTETRDDVACFQFKLPLPTPCGKMDDDDDMPNIDPPSRGVTPAPRDSMGRQSASSARPSTARGVSAGVPAAPRASSPGFGATPRPSGAGVPYDDESDDSEPLRASVARLSLGDAARRSTAGTQPRPSTAGRSSAGDSVWARDVVDELVQECAEEAGEGDEHAGWHCDAALDALADELVADEAGGDVDEPGPLRSSVVAPDRNATPRRSVHGSLLTTPSRYAGDSSDAEDALSPLSPAGGGFGARRSSTAGRSSLGGGDSTSSVSARKRDLAKLAEAGIAAAAARAAAQQQRAAAAAADASDAERCAALCAPFAPRGVWKRLRCTRVVLTLR